MSKYISRRSRRNRRAAGRGRDLCADCHHKEASLPRDVEDDLLDAFHHVEERDDLFSEDQYRMMKTLMQQAGLA